MGADESEAEAELEPAADEDPAVEPEEWPVARRCAAAFDEPAATSGLVEVVAMPKPVPT